LTAAPGTRCGRRVARDPCGSPGAQPNIGRRYDNWRKHRANDRLHRSTPAERKHASSEGVPWLNTRPGGNAGCQVIVARRVALCRDGAVQLGAAHLQHRAIDLVQGQLLDQHAGHRGEQLCL
jgi:hypothetical protein